MKLNDVKTDIDRYIYEKNLCIAVTKGDIQKTKNILDDFTSYIAQNIYKYNNINAITRLKYICSAVVSTYCHMSIEAGKSVSQSYRIVENIYKNLDNIRILEDIINVIISSTMEFVNFNYERTDLYSLPIRRAIDYINNHIYEKITLSDINKVSNLSNDYLSLKFKEEVKVNIKDYILSKKLETAKYDISLNHYSKDMYLNYGFSTQSYFIQCFKKEFGKTPKDYYLNVIEKTIV